MPIFSPASPEAQTAPILKTHEDSIKSQIPSTFQSIIPKESPSKLFGDYLTTGNTAFKDASAQALNTLSNFSNNANLAAKKFVAGGIPGLFEPNTPETYSDAFKQGLANRVASVEKQTANPMLLAGGTLGGEADLPLLLQSHSDAFLNSAKQAMEDTGKDLSDIATRKRWGELEEKAGNAASDLINRHYIPPSKPFLVGQTLDIPVNNLKPQQQGADLFNELGSGYADKLKNGATFPPIEVDSQGTILDGHNRWVASLLSGHKTIRANIVVPE